MRSSRIASLALFYTCVLSFAAYPQEEGTCTITAKEVQAHVDFLASDLLLGRDSGTPGADLAAQYIATQFELLGLMRVTDDWEMEFELPGATGTGDGILELRDQLYTGTSLIQVPTFSGTGSARGLLVAEDGDLKGNLVWVEGWSGDEEAKIKAQELIEEGAAGVCFVSEKKWLGAVARQGDFRRMGSRGPNDLLTRLAGKDESDGESGDVSQLPESIRKQIEEQLGIDISGAQVRVKIAGPEDLPEMMEKLGDAEGSMEFSIGVPEFLFGSSRLDAPVIQVSRTVGEFLLPAMEQKEEMTLQVPAAGSQVATNVLALVEGSDPALKNEYVVIGGHYDHVGADGEGNVWNGADDNASGTAAVLEIAEALASLETKPRRSVLLAAWGAEERGLVGSRAFLENPPVPKDKITAYINLDMISRNDPGSISILSASDDLKEWSKEAADAHGFQTQEISGFFLHASDTAPFMKNEIPTMSFFSGLHEDYHKASDDPDTIDADKAARVTRAAFDLMVRVANAEKVPAFTKIGKGGLGGLFSMGSGLSSMGKGKGRLLGIYPAIGSEGEGVLVSQVVYGSIAERAGIQEGDRILRIGDKTIQKTTDIRDALHALPEEDPFEIEVLRPSEEAEGEGEKKVLEGKFE
jgi:hypothetical protein